MSKIKFYTYPKCSTCQKAKRFLEEHSIDYEEVHIVETPPKKTELKQMLVFQGGELRKLFNTSGMVYRELQLKERLSSLSQREAFELLSGNGMLVKRPFLLGPNYGLLGFKEKEWKEAVL